MHNSECLYFINRSTLLDSGLSGGGVIHSYANMSSDVRAYIAIIKVEKEAPNFVSTYYAKKEVGDGLLELKTIFWWPYLRTLSPGAVALKGYVAVEQRNHETT